MSDADTELVSRARGGDRAAFEQLVRRTSRLVYARLYLDTGDAHSAEDLLQETYLSAYRGLPDLADPAGFRTWLLAIAGRAAIDAVRRNSRQKRSPPGGNETTLDGIPGKVMPPDQEALREEQRQRVLAVIRELPDDYRMPIMLRYIGEADAAAIGTQLGLTNGSLRGLLHRGLKLLRERLPADLAGE